MRTRVTLSLVAAASLVSLMTASRPSDADTEIAVDFNVGVPRLPKPSFVTGTGFDARIGKDFSLGAAHLTPEVCGGYVSLGSTVIRLLGGVRFSVAAPVSPSLFMHLGYGAIAYDADVGVGPEAGLVQGPAFDLGFALDLRPLSLFGAGVHAIYNGVQVSTDSPIETAAFTRSHWISLGGHAAVYF